MSADPSKDSCDHEYLSDMSPQDKPWDINKLLSSKLVHLYQGTIYHRLSERIGDCSKTLSFGWVTDQETGEPRFKLKSSLFCRCRNCIICQWRRALMWTARFLKAMPAILRDYPNARFIFLTLTVKSCDVSELRATLNQMNKAWKRMTERKAFPAIGFARSMEVTRNWDVYYKASYQGRMGGKTLKQWKQDHKGYDSKKLELQATTDAHPHFHALLMTDPGYFAGKNYLSQERWTELWQSCLRVNYTPIVNVKAVKPNKRWSENATGDLPAEQQLAGAIVETFKYSVKPSDLLGDGTEADRQWLLHLTQQLEKTRAIALGGVFKQYLSEAEPDDLVGRDEEGDDVSASSVYFGWREMVERYTKLWED